MKDTLHTDVLVVGAGPVGLAIANELHHFGVNCMLIDKEKSISTKSKALGVMPRTLELLERLGLDREFTKKGLKAQTFHVYSGEKELVKLDLSDKLHSKFPYVLMIPQNETEDILYRHLKRQGGEVLWQTTLTEIEEMSSHISVKIKRNSGASGMIAAKYVIGCDGVHSTVRKKAGLTFQGKALEQQFSLADLKVEWNLPRDEVFAFVKDGEAAAFFPMKDGQHRVVFTSDEDELTSITLEEIQSVIERVGPSGARVHSPTWKSRFRIHQRMVESGKAGRVFLAGDAAHVHSPLGAQGMNMGIQDGVNLVWKLAFVLHYHAPQQLLSTYSEERVPVWENVLKRTELGTKMILSDNSIFSAVRNYMAPKISSLQLVEDFAVTTLSQLNVTYQNSSLSKGKRRFMGSRKLQAGERIPNVTLGDGEQLISYLSGKGLLLLLFTDGHSQVEQIKQMLKSFSTPVSIITPGNSGASTSLEQQFGIAKEGMILIRPDGYAGFVSDEASSEDLEKYLRQHFWKS
ncbi:hypothetical protein GJU40_17505 [Bacillus lacus]|uniref:FAD-binding domain-containing protein n=1 Tax=Metabacillus lacus TaxID=1983721 RepID=A0A7X2J3C3_9BACI|nr:FAD-dependent monooxygenase [Metabacillus lacus]MRX73933.1 hypothetical protein [Metabacillus lacus]